jgi:pimeloyl-ACP methyl ester carboxylesterase
MSLATSPSILLLDEPLAGMGAEESARIVALLKQLSGTHAILLIEHDMDAVFALADCLTVMVDGHKIFYREAGNPKAPVVLLLHGFPTSSHMYRELIPALADRYHVVAPDLPGFGFTEAPDRKTFKYTFDHLTGVIERFTEFLGLSRYALYVFDYGAPVGFRLALRHPERITALISQNGNAYEEGLSEGWNPIQAYWKRTLRRKTVRPCAPS